MAEITKLIQYDELKKIKIGQIKDSWSHDLRPSYVKNILKILSVILLLDFFQKRRLRKIKNSIVENGYNPEKYGYILIFQEKGNKDHPYRARDGNHRLRILKELYGNEHEITVMLSVNAPDAKREIETTWGELWDGTSKLPIILIPSIIFFLWYMFLDVILVSVTCYFFMMFTTDISSRALTDTHPKKRLGWLHDNAKLLYQGIMTIYYNYRRIILLLIIIIYTYHVVTTHLLGLLIIGGITILLRLIFEKLYNDVNISFPELIDKIKSR
tara:strand:- start:1113 stop:1922 length:810 start_codon:yes stop_codon:yes gene_type:complete